MRPFSLYVHIPYCQAKCPYCDFNSYAATTWPEERYTQALVRELSQSAAQAQWADRPLSTIFIGGGTPSLFRPESLAMVLQHVQRLWPIASDIEITIEANPGTVSLESLTGFHHAGINRISFGVQSFHDHHLVALGRIHNSADAVTALQAAHAAGFRRINLDLIYALHGQTLAEWLSDLQQACDLRPDHISAYNLTYEEGTAFYEWRQQGRLRPLPEDLEIEMFAATEQLLGEAGYRRYEISNYAQAEQECRHNLNYWRCGDYLGVGAGAHGYCRSPTATELLDGRRWSNWKAPTAYLKAVEQYGTGQEREEEIDGARSRGEFVFLNLRCREGFAADAFEAHYGQLFEQAFPHVTRLVDQGVIETLDGRWALTPRGLFVADTVFASFL